jgi:hypothetical protein
MPYDTYVFRELRSEANDGLQPVTFEVEITRDSSTLDMGTVDDAPIPTRPVSLSTELESEAGLHIVPATEQIALVDCVAYRNLEPGADYEMRGRLVDKANGEPVGDPASVEFAAQKGDGSIDVPLTADTSKLVGHEIVAYQELYRDGTLIAEHKDLADTAETASIPALSTELTGTTGAKTLAPGEAAKLVDRVDYAGLQPGLTYTLAASLHVRAADGDDAGVLVDAAGAEVRSELSFTPQTANGSCTVPFTFACGEVPGRAVVAFEELLVEGTPYAQHADIADAGQAVSVLAPPDEEPEPAPDDEDPEPAPPETTASASTSSSTSSSASSSASTPSWSSPAKPSAATTASGKGKAYDQTGNLLSRYWWVAALVVGIGIVAAVVALVSRKPDYTSWD